ncbi:hypothetical protein GCM10023169_22020 [Georgenia halophila]|uniref:Uncharacterized protein n=1 Tax=Georgenia halophila TaxID=620889 RepID=A0ABP8L9Q6_9MICO
MAALLSLLCVLVLTACDGDEHETDETRAMEDELGRLDGVVEASVRYFDEDDDWLSIDLDLGNGRQAAAVPPLAHAVRSSVEASDYRDNDLIATIAWTDGEHEREMNAYGPARTLGALSNEVAAMTLLERHDFERVLLNVSDNATYARYAREIDITVPVNTPGRAFVRLYDILRTQLPDQGQETRFSLAYDDWETEPGHRRRFVALSSAAPELVDRADALLRSPVPEGWRGGTDLGVSVDGVGTAPQDQYLSLRMALEPTELRDADARTLEDRADDAAIMEPAHHLAETMATPVGRAMYDLTVANDAGYVEVAAFYSANCAQAWADDSGRSRAVWKTWVVAGGEPEDGATATHCPDA